MERGLFKTMSFVLLARENFSASRQEVCRSSTTARLLHLSNNEKSENTTTHTTESFRRQLGGSTQKTISGDRADRSIPINTRSPPFPVMSNHHPAGPSSSMTNRKASTAGPLSNSQKNLTAQSSSSPSNASNSPGPENFILEIHKIPKILSRSDYSDIEEQPMLKGFRQPDSTPEFPATSDDLVNRIKNHLSQGQFSITFHTSFRERC